MPSAQVIIPNMPPDPPEHDVERSPDRSRMLLFEFLQANEAKCPVCGYNVHRLTSDICPECGQRLELRVGTAGARFGALYACLAPLLMMSGIGVFMLVMTLRYGPPRGHEAWFYLLLVFGVIDALLAALLYSRRVWFLRRPRQSQNALVLAGSLLNLTALVATVFLSK